MLKVSGIFRESLYLVFYFTLNQSVFPSIYNVLALTEKKDVMEDFLLVI